MKYLISEVLLNALLQYLHTRPYREVVGLIDSLKESVEPASNLCQCSEPCENKED